MARLDASHQRFSVALKQTVGAILEDMREEV